MNDTAAAHKMLPMRLLGRNSLKDLRQILLATDKDIPSTHVETTRQRYNAIYNQLGVVKLLGMSFRMLAVLNVVDLLKYRHMTYDAVSWGGGAGSSSSIQKRTHEAEEEIWHLPFTQRPYLCRFSASLSDV